MKRQQTFRAISTLATILAAACSGSANDLSAQQLEIVMIKKATPILFVEDVQKSVDFFTGTLGFSKTIEAPYENGLQFAAVETNGVEIMLQTTEIEDPNFTRDELIERKGNGFVYFEIEDFDKLAEAVSSAKVFKEAHTTDYGSREIYIREPGGNILGFAQHAQSND